MRLGEPRDRKREICPMRLPAALLFDGCCWKSRSERGERLPPPAMPAALGPLRASPAPPIRALLHAPRVRPDGAGSSRSASL